MISAEAPVLFAKACELFILDLTMRAWAASDDGKRRILQVPLPFASALCKPPAHGLLCAPLQRSDIADAITNCEMFDFLIDIVPREEASAQTQARLVCVAFLSPPVLPSFVFTR
jgi:nuclear transcription factor Y gamma